MDAGFIIAISVLVSVLFIVLAYYFLKWRFQTIFYRWQENQIIVFEEETERIRQAAITQSRAVLGGKFTEQLTPFLPEFKYDPTEARFIGSPIDIIVFPGLATGDPQEIVIMEIKTGKHCQLTYTQKKIRQLIEAGMVRWELIEYTERQDETGIQND